MVIFVVLGCPSYAIADIRSTKRKQSLAINNNTVVTAPKSAHHNPNIETEGLKGKQ